MNDRKTITLIAIVLAVAVSLPFLIVTPATTNFLIGYGFALLGIGGLWICASTMIGRRGGYPWIAAIPIAAMTYLIVEVIASIAVVLLAQFGIWTMPITWFILVHAIILAIFAIRIVTLLAGARHIDVRGEATQQKVIFIRSMQVDVEMMAAKTVDESLKKALTKFAEKIRYSDPMSHTGLSTLETKIGEMIIDLKLAVADGKNGKAAGTICDVEQLLEERNKSCRLLK